MTLFFIGIAELAAHLGIARGTLHKHLSGTRQSPILQGLPDPVSRRGKTLWISQDIEDWLETRRTFRPVPIPEPEPQLLPLPQPPRRGRPRKIAIGEGKGGAK
jgi:predicted DNA-binding transcriptional regulator AlpA